MIIKIKVHTGRNERDPEPKDISITTGALAFNQECMSQYDEWLEDHIRDEDPLVLEALNQIAEASLTENGANLVCDCGSITCHGHIIYQHVIEAFRKAYPDSFPDKRAKWRNDK